MGFTSYSLAVGGANGYINIGGWNSTLTDVANTAKEVVGVVRYEGANAYMYVQYGTTTIVAGGAFLAQSTALPDTNAVTPPIAMTALVGTSVTGTIARGMNVAAVGSGVRYGWCFIEGIATGYMMTDSAMLTAALVCPSTSTANLLDGGAAVTTAVGRVLIPCATATAQSGGVGSLVYWRFRKPF